MNGIKFRAWCKKGKGFIQGFNLFGFHRYYTKGQEPSVQRYNTTWKLSEIDLMQSIGVSDSCGVEIFEGDILMHPDGKKFAIKYFDYCCGFKAVYDYHNLCEDHASINLQIGKKGLAVVVGTIYETRK